MVLAIKMVLIGKDQVRFVAIRASNCVFFCRARFGRKSISSRSASTRMLCDISDPPPKTTTYGCATLCDLIARTGNSP